MTYDEILDKMRKQYTKNTGTIPDDASDIGIRLKVLAGELLAAHAEISWLKNQVFPTTASGEYLELHAAARGLERKQAAKAEGDVDFYLSYKRSADLTIPEGTIISTSGSAPVRFETIEEGVIPGGSISVTVRVRAVNPGANGNVAAHAISTLVTPIVGIDHIHNDYLTGGGADEETDEELRKRVLDSFVHIPNGTNKAYYISRAMSVEGVSSVGVIARGRGAGTVDVYIADESGSASDLLIAKVSSILEKERELNVDVKVYALHAVPYDVHMILSVKSGYDFGEVSEKCRAALRRYLSAMGGGETVYLSELAAVVEPIEGVENFSFRHFLTDDTPISPDSAARPGTIVIEERETV